MKICQYCQKELKRKVWFGKRKYTETLKRFNQRKFCDNLCRSKQLSITNSGKNNYFFGKHLRPYNYKSDIRWRITPKQSYIRIIYKDKNGKKYFKYEHREVIEGYLNRPLLKDEVIHHIDNNIHNNRLENLQICTPQEHRQLHKK